MHSSSKSVIATKRQAMPQDLGAHPLSVGLALTQATILAAVIALAAASGTDIHWLSAAPAIVLIAVCLGIWLYLFAQPGRNRQEWLVAEGLLVFSLLLLVTLMLLPAQYLVSAWSRPVIDPWLARADALMGFHVPDFANWAKASPLLVRILDMSYNSLAYQFALAVPVLVALRQRRELWEYAFHFHFCALVTVVCFTWFPAECAFNFYGFEPAISQGAFSDHFYATRLGAMRTLVFGQMEGLVSAPSFHVAGGIMVTWATRRVGWLFVPTLALNISLWSATFLTGTHYVVDAVLSVAMFAISVLVWRSIRGVALRDVSKQPASQFGEATAAVQ